MVIRIQKSKLRIWAIGCAGILLLVLIALLGYTIFTSLQKKDSAEGQLDNPHAHHMKVTDDRSFIYEMIPHHQEAVDTSQYITVRTNNQALKEFTAKVVAAQAKEISDMKSWYLKYWNMEYALDSSTAGYVPMMRDLTKLEGRDRERAYVMDMITHHEGAIFMARQILGKTEVAEVKTLAANIIDGQSAEIDFLRNLLTEL